MLPIPRINDTSAENSTPRPALRAMNLDEMTSLVTQAGFKPFRARQLYQWVFTHGIESFDRVPNLPRPMLNLLAEQTRLNTLQRVQVTGPPGSTRKVLFQLGDGKRIESVLMRDPAKDQVSLCLSSQVGCALKCGFCLTGVGGFIRNLTIDEIVGQAIEIRRNLLEPDETITHVVFMGMGEPMLNLDAVIPAIRLLTDPEGFKLSRRRLTLSTAGNIPGIERFGKAELGGGLAVSLNATTDTIRSEIMPINKQWPIKELLAALRRYPLEPRRRITIEYVLLKGINDTTADARRLVGLLHNLSCKVNLIMFNPSPRLPYEPVDGAGLDRFAAVLSEAHLTVTVRWSKGQDIGAACGQLAGHNSEIVDD